MRDGGSGQAALRPDAERFVLGLTQAPARGRHTANER